MSFPRVGLHQKNDAGRCFVPDATRRAFYSTPERLRYASCQDGDGGIEEARTLRRIRAGGTGGRKERIGEYTAVLFFSV